MEVKGQLTSTSDPVTCPERKHKERMAELQERRRGLQALLSTRLAELRRICLQEVELTGAVPTDFPLEAGEKPTCVRRRGGTSRQGNRKSRSEDEDSQRSKPKKNLFSGALRKHNDPEHNTHIHTHHGKRTVHRGCHTDTVRSESSSTSDSPGIENDDGGSRPLLVSSGSPVVLFQNKTRRSSLHIRTDLPETLQTLKPLPLHPPPPRSQDSSSGPSEGRGGEGLRGRDGRSSQDSSSGPSEGRGGEGLRGEWSGEEGRGGAAYSDVLLDYVWGKQQQLHLQQPHSRHPIASQHELLFHGSSPEPLGAPPTYRDSAGGDLGLPPGGLEDPVTPPALIEQPDKGLTCQRLFRPSSPSPSILHPPAPRTPPPAHLRAGEG
ncbi:FERM domain-containing protein 4A [Pseudoliparis swirei]|uniref:FERM domain-containing protein 4A n=1 Tax=Pseudoliparis swirei TaxID=2059687 RepID=UPI0024BDF54F|nr:FERM domain-containing protein 4A [Pseudoliparis swirei]